MKVDSERAGKWGKEWKGGGPRKRKALSTKVQRASPGQRLFDVELMMRAETERSSVIKARGGGMFLARGRRPTRWAPGREQRDWRMRVSSPWYPVSEDHLETDPLE
ncbi:hypothetical protein AAFF_G00210210 [Aldrovandia affinis]|uniref:Uncharacterized protein n=1 Tax=Aldrovandia affinis TaxID=143900 RepID=A0AAD7WV03_9TELE|nr:hypothetical protein AAFF_G00210210 [Aldrovandia affinis]